MYIIFRYSYLFTEIVIFSMEWCLAVYVGYFPDTSVALMFCVDTVCTVTGVHIKL